MNTQGQSDLANLITQRQAEIGISDDDLAAAAGYDSGKIVSMIKRGAMRVPANKAIAFADALQLNRRDFFGALVREYIPELWEVIQQVFPPADLTQTEANLLRHVRTLSKGRDASPVVLDGAGVIALIAVQ